MIEREREREGEGRGREEEEGSERGRQRGGVSGRDKDHLTLLVFLPC